MIGAMRGRWHPAVSTRVFVAQVALLLVVAVVGSAAFVWAERDRTDDDARERTTAVAVAIATAPSTAEALTSPDPTALLAPETDAVSHATGMDFIVVMAPDRTRYTHANPARIGGRFTGTVDRALRGETFTEEYTGSLGPSIRAVTPVYDEDGVLIGLVSAGVTRARLADQVRRVIPIVAVVVLVGLAVSVGVALLLERRLRRQTLGLTPDALRELYEHHDAVLHAIAEGMIVFDDAAPDGPAAVVNDEARRLLDLPDGPIMRADLPASLRGDDDLVDEVHISGDRVLLANRQAVTGAVQRIGTVLTVRDRTDLQEVLGELDAVRSLANALSAQAHEHANRMHSVVTMIELGRRDDAVDFATQQLTSSQGLVDQLASAADPAVTALVVAKVAEAAAVGVEVTVADGADLVGGPLTAAESLTAVGNLVDNAVDAAGVDGWVEVDAGIVDGQWSLRVLDSGPGMSDEEFERARERGYSTKAGLDRIHGRGQGLALLSRLAQRRGGTLTVHRDPSTVELVLPRDTEEN
ncbi:ATP-binding protein [Gordonia sp. HY285]|uniref:sensor histidine kinase n=1 Tax=Gordonia liuliyuniae TaxID=2911517 RepID=UPI001F424922|nr:ATP-binding protein [Gordonia liuliyuniae]MCF8610362.1 ATP-binding protein [Gordonia liuliyuniae]